MKSTATSEALTAALIVGSLVLAGCDGNRAATPPPPAETSPANEPAATEALVAQVVTTVSSGDLWVDAATTLGTVADTDAESVARLGDLARARVVSRRALQDELRIAQYRLAELVATEGDSAAARKALEAFTLGERAALVEEARLAEAFLGGSGAAGHARLVGTDVFETGYLGAIRADVKSLGLGARQFPLDANEADDRVRALILRLRYSLAADAVAIDGAVSTVSRSIDQANGTDANAAAALSASVADLGERISQLQREKYRIAVELRSALGPAGWTDLLGHWSLVEFFGCVACVSSEDEDSLAETLLGIEAQRVHTSGGRGVADGIPSAPGAQLNQGGQMVQGSGWAGIPEE